MSAHLTSNHEGNMIGAAGLPAPSGAAADWLSPSEALQRFSPPQDLLWHDAQQDKPDSRYGYRIGALRLLIKRSSGSEVLRGPAVSSLPGSVPWLLGIMNLRGSVVPVFDLASLLGVKAATSKRAPIVLVLDKGDDALGVVIDDFPQALKQLRPIVGMPQLPAQLQEHIAGAFIKDDDIWLDFQHQGFFRKLSSATGMATSYEPA
jgi:twitching motility protein PilI